MMQPKVNSMKIRSMFQGIFIACLLIVGFISRGATVEVYRSPGGNFPHSPHYKVTVNGKDSFVYHTTPPEVGARYIGEGRSFSWTSFSFEGDVTVEITKLKGPISDNTIRILPRRAGYSVTASSSDKQVELVNSNTLRMTISKPCQLSIELGERIKSYQKELNKEEREQKAKEIKTMLAKSADAVLG